MIEAFDCGLLGEGLLPTLAAAKARILARGGASRILPLGAAVHCQLGFIGPPGLPQHKWRALAPGQYEEVDLGATGWRPVTAPKRAFAFDLLDPETYLEGSSKEIQLVATETGQVRSPRFTKPAAMSPLGP